MPKLALLAVCFVLGNIAVAQDFIGDKRQKVRKNFEKYLQATAITDKLQETDSSLVLTFRHLQFKPVDFIFLFDGEDECIAEIKIGCDTCMANYLQNALDKSSYQWKQTGANQFHSNSRFRLSMELLANQTGSRLVIRKLFLNRRDYLKLLKERKD